MRVALIRASVAPSGAGGGGTRQMLELASGLRELGHDVVIGSFHLERERELAEFYPGLTWRSVVRAPSHHPRTRLGRLNWYWRDMRAVARILGSVDAVNAHEWPALHAGAVAARTQHVPFVWTRNDSTIFESQLASHPAAGFGRVRQNARALAYAGDRLDVRNARAVVVLDSKSAALAAKAYRRPVRIVRSGPHPSFFNSGDRIGARTRLGVAPETFLVLSVGVMLVHRRFEDVVAAMGRIPRELPIRAVIVGSDRLAPQYADYLAQQIVAMGVDDRVQLVRSDIDDAGLRDLYAAADVFVHPQDGQTYGLAPLEALATGTPVIVSTGAGVHEILGGRAGVVLVEPRQAPQLAAAILNSYRQDRQDLRATQDWLRSELSRTRYAEAMLELFA